MGESGKENIPKLFQIKTTSVPKTLLVIVGLILVLLDLVAPECLNL